MRSLFFALITALALVFVFPSISETNYAEAKTVKKTKKTKKGKRVKKAKKVKRVKKNKKS